MRSKADSAGTVELLRSAPPFRTERAKPLHVLDGETRKRLRAEHGGRALASAIAAVNCSVTEVAEAMRLPGRAEDGVNEKLLRAIVSGEQSLNYEQIVALPTDVGLALSTALKDYFESRLRTTCAPLPLQASRATIANGKMTEAIVDALSDGIIDHDEIERIEASALSAESYARVVRISATALRGKIGTK